MGDGGSIVQMMAMWLRKLGQHRNEGTSRIGYVKPEMGPKRSHELVRGVRKLPKPAISITVK